MLCMTTRLIRSGPKNQLRFDRIKAMSLVYAVFLFHPINTATSPNGGKLRKFCETSSNTN